jgi:hypothetical protein
MFNGSAIGIGIRRADAHPEQSHTGELFLDFGGLLKELLAHGFNQIGSRAKLPGTEAAFAEHLSFSAYQSKRGIGPPDINSRDSFVHERMATSRFYRMIGLEIIAEIQGDKVIKTKKVCMRFCAISDQKASLIRM